MNKWTKEEVDFLKENHKKYTIKEISKELGRGYHHVKYKLKSLNLDFPREWREWNKNEEEYLKENYLTLTYKEIGKFLNKSKKAVSHKARSLGINKINKISRSEILRKYYETHKHPSTGKNLSEETKKKLSESMKKYLAKLNPEISKLIRQKQIKTRIERGSQSGINHPWYGKKRPEFREFSKKQWKNIEHRKKVLKSLSKASKKSSKNQEFLFNFLKESLINKKIIYNNWKILNYRSQIDIAIPYRKIAIEWDGYYWHVNKTEKDYEKNQKILDEGWKFIRVIDNKINQTEMNIICQNIMDLIKRINSPKFKYTGGFYIN